MYKRQSLIKTIFLVVISLIANIEIAFSAEPSELLSQQTSVIAQNIQADAAACATGTTQGTIGNAIATSMRIHTEIASATPNTESLFAVDNNCFSGLSQIFDLSFAIPSLGSILAAAEDALIAYAQKEICTAVGEMSGMVTSPINQALGNVNQYMDFYDLNGMLNDQVSQQMYQIDPDLGSEYHAPPPGSTYTVNTNPFNSQQVQFSSLTNTPNTQVSNSYNQLNSSLASLNTQMSSVQMQVSQANLSLGGAQTTLQNCQAAQVNDCSQEQQAYINAQGNLMTLNAQLIALQDQLNNTYISGSSPASTIVPAQNSQNTSEQTEESTYQWMNNLINSQ